LRSIGPALGRALARSFPRTPRLTVCSGSFTLEFYSPEDFAEHYAHSRQISLTLPQVAIQTEAGLSGPTGIHPAYDKQESEKAIRRRYKLLVRQLIHTLPRLFRDSPFMAAVCELRREGWKDWHILQATAAIRTNYIINATLSPRLGLAELREATKSLLERDERDSDPETPTSMFTFAALRQSLKMSQISTLAGLGFECHQRTPNFAGVNRFLERFNYWTDDVPHAAIFPE
jgi:hypothetical protein